MLPKLKTHCVESVQIQSFFWSVFSCIRTKYGDLLITSSSCLHRRHGVYFYDLLLLFYLFLFYSITPKNSSLVCRIYPPSPRGSAGPVISIKCFYIAWCWWNYNHGHNILRIFVSLPNFLFTTSEMKHDY